MDGDTFKVFKNGGQKLGRKLNDYRKNLIKCEIHRDQRLENFCVDHGCVCCYECVVSLHSHCCIQPLDEMSVNYNDVEIEQLCSSLYDINNEITIAIGDTVAGLDYYQELTDEFTAVTDENSKPFGCIPFAEDKNSMKQIMQKLCFLCREFEDRLCVTGQTFVHCVNHKHDLISLVVAMKSRQRLEEVFYHLSLAADELFKDRLYRENNKHLVKMKEQLDNVFSLTKKVKQILNTIHRVEKEAVCTRSSKSYSDSSQAICDENISTYSTIDREHRTRVIDSVNQQGDRPISGNRLSEQFTILGENEDEKDKKAECETENDSCIETRELSVSIETNETTVASGSLVPIYKENTVKITPRDLDIQQGINNDDSNGYILVPNVLDSQQALSKRYGCKSSSMVSPHRLSISRSLSQDIVLSTNRILSKRSNPPGQYRQSIQVQHHLKLVKINQQKVVLPNDVLPCNIYDIACMPDGKVVVSDVNNVCLKLFGVDTDRVGCLFTKYPPYSLVCVSNSLLMFVSGHARNRLNLVSVTTGLEIRQEFTTNHACIALATNNSFVYVLCEINFRTECHILNTEGVVNMKIDIGSHVKFPQFIAVDPISERVIITDNEGVYSFDRSGRKITHCQDKAISNYKGVAVDSRGNIFVCTCFPDGIYAMPRTKNYLQPQLLGPEMKQVHAICYSERDNSIFVSYSDSDYIRQYKIISD